MLPGACSGFDRWGPGQADQLLAVLLQAGAAVVWTQLQGQAQCLQQYAGGDHQQGGAGWAGHGRTPGRQIREGPSMDAAAVEKVAWHRPSISSKPFSGSRHPRDMLDTSMPAPPAANDAVDEPALVRAAAAGDTAAYELLYRRHAPRVFAVLWRLCGGQQARAEDALQEAFLQAWKALPGFRFESSLSTWLHRLGVNAALMELRGRAAGQDHDSLDEV